GSGSNVLDGGAGDDTIAGGVNGDTINGGSGSDVISDAGGADIIDGGAGNDSINAGAGDDSVTGSAGNDTIAGGAGSDALTGGAGRDNLWGGDQNNTSGDGTFDVFVINSLSESGTTSATRDTIWDFENGIDLIGLDPIDAKSATVNNDDFAFIGDNKAFSHTAGELRAVSTASGWIIEGDVTGDAKADFSVAVHDPTHIIDWTNVNHWAGVTVV